jgi:hypothetical protein
MRADYFRYCAVLALGGVYADASFRCIAPLHPLLDRGDGTIFRKTPPGFILNGFFLFASPGHPLLRLALDVATANIEQRAGEMVQMVTGPWIFTALSVLHRLGSIDRLRRDAADGGLMRLAEPFRQEAMALARTASGRAGVAPMVEPLFDTVGDLERVEEAFGGVRVAPFEEMTEAIAEPEGTLPHKDSETSWIRWQGRGQTIFR